MRLSKIKSLLLLAVYNYGKSPKLVSLGSRLEVEVYWGIFSGSISARELEQQN